jgi:hypothetical protein
VDRKKESKKRPPIAGQLEWTRPLPAATSAQPAYDATRAFVPLESAKVVGVSLADGAIAWTVDAEASGGLGAGDGLVFVPLGTAIEARDAQDGASRWRVAVDGRLSAPLAWDNGWLIAGTDRGTVAALRANSGQPVWQQALASPVRGAAFAGDRLYVALDDGRIVALAIETGARIWEQPLGGRPTAMTPLDDRLFVGADDKFLYCLSARNGRPLWRWRTGGTIVGLPVVDQDNVYFLALDNVLRALDRGNGTQAWHAPVPFRPLAGPYLNGQLLLVAGLAQVRAFQVVDGSDAGVIEVANLLAAPPHFLPAPADAEDRVSPLLVFTREAEVQRIAAIGLPLPSKPFPAKMVYPLFGGES